MKVLLVGASGFLGRAVLNRLVLEGHEVIASDLALPSQPDLLEKARWVVGDMAGLDWSQAAGGVEGVICTAASLAMGFKIQDWESCVQANIQGFHRLFKWACEAGVSRFAFTSSAGLYLRPVKSLPVAEDSEIKPLTAYWTTKLLDEQLVFSQDRPEGLVPWAFRLSSPYGPGQPVKSVLPLFIKLVKEGSDLKVMGEGLRSQDFIHVDDAAEAHVRAMTAAAPAHPGPINLGSGEETSMKGLAERVIEVFGGCSQKVNHAEPDGSDSDRFVLDVRRLKNDLGVNPRHLDEGLRQWKVQEP